MVAHKAGAIVGGEARALARDIAVKAELLRRAIENEGIALGVTFDFPIDDDRDMRMHVWGHATTGGSGTHIEAWIEKKKTA